MKLVDLELQLHHETEKAFLLGDESKDEDGKFVKKWVPKSTVERNDDGTFTMPEWLAIEEGWI